MTAQRLILPGDWSHSLHAQIQTRQCEQAHIPTRIRGGMLCFSREQRSPHMLRPMIPRHAPLAKLANFTEGGRMAANAAVLCARDVLIVTTYFAAP